MARLAFWNPNIKDEDIDTIEVWSGSTSDPATFTELISLDSRNGYNNWITHYNDSSATTTTYYQAHFFKEGVEIGPRSTVKLGVEPLQVTPQDVMDTIQGLPSSFATAEMVQTYIEMHKEEVETRIHQRLGTNVIVKERYGKKAYNKILGDRAGFPIQLRHFPVVSVEGVFYQVRGATSGAEQEITGIDTEIEAVDAVTGYNRGIVTMFATNVSLTALFAGLNWVHEYYAGRIEILISYTHGWATWPRAIERVVRELSAGSIMEIIGEAITAGISSRSLDGYSESFTASATTTIYSARRIMYEKNADKTIERYSKPIWG